MHNERLKRIAKFLGNQGLYTEANNLIKVAGEFDKEGGGSESFMAGEDRSEAIRLDAEQKMKEELAKSIISAREGGLTLIEIAEIFDLKLEEVMRMAEPPTSRKDDEEWDPTGYDKHPDAINDYIIG